MSEQEGCISWAKERRSVFFRWYVRCVQVSITTGQDEGVV